VKPMPDKVFVRPGRHVVFTWTLDAGPQESRVVVTGPAWIEKRDGGFFVYQAAAPGQGAETEGWLS
jgi:hypothetical protein